MAVRVEGENYSKENPKCTIMQDEPTMVINKDSIGKLSFANGHVASGDWFDWSFKL
jgi:hypothetical protein